MNREVIRNTARKKLGETTAVFWDDSLLNQWAEDAQLDVVWKARCNRQKSLATTTAIGTLTTRYKLTTLVNNILRVFSVRIYNSAEATWNRVKSISPQDLDAQYPNWLTADAGVPILYTVDYDVDEFVLYPSADSNHVGSNYLELYNSSKPTAMTEDGHTPDMPQVLHPTIIDYIVATGLESRGYQDIANTQWQQYYGKIKSYLIERNVEEDVELVMHAER